jgi:cytochrome c biogenesis protein CcmG, thiol:disulfide interchange protein DsbE
MAPARAAAAAVAVLGAAALAGCGSAAATGTETSAGAPPSSAPAVHNVLQSCPGQPHRPASGSRTLPRLRFSCPGGGTLDLGRAPGVPTVVNLWGSWCGPCRDELPILQRLADAAGDRVHVVGVISKDGLPQAESFAADAGVSFPSAFDGQGDLMAGVGINVLPYTYFLDADGAVVYTQVGPVASIGRLKALVAEHLKVSS